MPHKPPVDKIFDLEQLLTERASWRQTGLKTVFTNGCFDLIHRGHVEYLYEASTLGDRLIIGLNSDHSVRGLKGPGRPVKDQSTRAMLLASLYFVDAVILFESETPLELIKAVVPDVLVKGGDWKTEQIVGSSIVLDHGGEVRSLGFVQGHSSTNLVKKIREN